MKYVVVGGGIAGVTCAYELLKKSTPSDSITLISASEHVKTVNNWVKFFTVTETNLFPKDDRFRFIKGEVIKWEPELKCVKTSTDTVSYDRLCIATGAKPYAPYNHPKIVTLRDSDSAYRLQQLVKPNKTIAIIGNGGIATELVYELKNAKIHWVLRDAYPSSVFFLPQVSKFLESRILKGKQNDPIESEIHKRPRFAVGGSTSKQPGCALGPDWNTAISIEGASNEHSVEIHCLSDVEDIICNEKLILKLKSKEEIECDCAILAMGVTPFSAPWKSNCPELKLANDGGIEIDDQMKTSIKDVYACGDVCTVNWPGSSSLWKQMRLWTQARQIGLACAQSMASSTKVELDFCFEVFAHVTYFCGMKIVLLGDFKGENQVDEWYIRERIIGDEEYVCCIMKNRRVVGATLVGETKLEETLENLIINETDLFGIEDHFLDPGVDIEDYFD